MVLFTKNAKSDPQKGKVIQQMAIHTLSFMKRAYIRMVVLSRFLAFLCRKLI